MSLKPGFWYRKSFFQRYGLSEPQTWDEFVQLLEKLKGVQGVKAPIASGDGVGWPLSDVTEAFIIAYAGPDVFKGLIDGSVKFTDPRVVAVFRDRLVPLLKKGYFGEPTEWTAAVQQWWNGEYGIYFMPTKMNFSLPALSSALGSRISTISLRMSSRVAGSAPDMSDSSAAKSSSPTSSPTHRAKSLVYLGVLGALS